MELYTLSLYIMCCVIIAIILVGCCTVTHNIPAMELRSIRVQQTLTEQKVHTSHFFFLFLDVLSIQAYEKVLKNKTQITIPHYSSNNYKTQNTTISSHNSNHPSSTRTTTYYYIVDDSILITTPQLNKYSPVLLSTTIIRTNKRGSRYWMFKNSVRHAFSHKDKVAAHRRQLITRLRTSTPDMCSADLFGTCAVLTPTNRVFEVCSPLSIANSKPLFLCCSCQLFRSV